MTQNLCFVTYLIEKKKLERVLQGHTLKQKTKKQNPLKLNKLSQSLRKNLT